MKPLNLERGGLDEIGPLNSFYFTLDFFAAHHFSYAIFSFFFFKDYLISFSYYGCTLVCRGKKGLKLGKNKKTRKNFYVQTIQHLNHFKSDMIHSLLQFNCTHFSSELFVAFRFQCLSFWIETEEKNRWSLKKIIEIK